MTRGRWILLVVVLLYAALSVRWNAKPAAPPRFVTEIHAEGALRAGAAHPQRDECLADDTNTFLHRQEVAHLLRVDLRDDQDR